MDATDLTQLSSREQLSALMDGALPADETRFLLRRLQHDDSLAECWERWRLSAEVMRGLAPAQRLPADFASRVAASLRGGDQHRGARAETVASGKKHAVRTPAWLRWGGGAAIAASLVVVAFMTQPVALESPGNLAAHTVVAVTNTAPSPASDAVALSKAPAPKTPAPQAPVQDPAGAGLQLQTALASAVAAIARPARNNRRSNQARETQAASMLTAANDTQPIGVGVAAASNILPSLPQADITTRPWPRSVFPQAGNPGITVGFGDSARNTAPYNPFQVRRGIGNLPQALIVDPPTASGEAATPANDQTGRAASSDPQS